MINITPENLELAEDQMSENLYAAFYSPEVVQIFNHISEKHGIDFNQLYDCVFCVFLALIPLSQLATEIQNFCQIPPEKAQEVTIDIRHFILESLAQDFSAIQEIAEKNYQIYKQ